MGLEQSITFTPGKVPRWPEVRDRLAARGYPVQTRMIDGQLAFPGEEPPEEWRELRLSTGQGMVTLRRDGDRMTVVTWGNADAAALQAWNGLTWAFAEAGGGTIHAAAGKQDAGEFQRTADLPAELRGA